MKLTKLLSLTCAALILLTSCASAETINAVFDKSERKLSISGELGAQSSNSRVVVLIAKDDVQFPEISDEDYAENVSGELEGIENMFQVKSDENGNYIVQDVIEPLAGNLTIYVSSDNMENRAKEQIFIPTKNAADDFVNKIQTASNAGDIATCLSEEESNATENPEKAFGANFKWYKMLSAGAKATVAQNLYSEKKSGKYSDNAAQKIDDDIYIYSYLAYLAESDNAEELEKLFDISSSDYSTNDKNLIVKMLDLETEYQNSIFTFLNGAMENVKSEIAAAAVSKDVTAADKFKDAIYVSVFNYKFSEKYANGWRDAYRILKEHSDVLPTMNISKLNANESNQAMFMSIISKTHDNTKQICDAVNNWQDSSSDSSGGSNGGGGKTSSKTGSGSITTTTPITPVSSEPFDDLSNHEWAKGAIETLYKRGVVNGIGNKTFNPDGEVKREEFVKIIVSALNISGTDNAVQFTDNVPDSWYTSYVETAASAGIISGLGDGRFGVGENITRQDVAVIVCNALRYSGVALNAASGGEFADLNEISDYAKDKVASLCSLGLISGRGNGIFAPKEYMTRAETAVLVYNVLNMFAR